MVPDTGKTVAPTTAAPHRPATDSPSSDTFVQFFVRISLGWFVNGMTYKHGLYAIIIIKSFYIKKTVINEIGAA